MSRFFWIILYTFFGLSQVIGQSPQPIGPASLPYQEQVYVQLNQELFLSGDTVWAGVHVLESEFLTPSQLSKVAYLEIWAEGSAIIKRRVILHQSAAMVGMELPSDLRSGIYMVRAYTRWMRNGPEAMYFRHWIRVVNPQSPPAIKEPEQLLFPVAVEFVLEGGQLIANQKHSLHIRTKNWDGSPASTHGFLIAGLADTIRAFHANERGYCSLEFTAEPETGYQLVVKTSEDAFESIPVGDSRTVGIGLRLVEEEGESYLRIVGGEDELRYDAKVGVVERGSVRMLPQMSFRSDEGSLVRLADLKLRNAVSQFVLWDGNGTYLGSCFWSGGINPDQQLAQGTASTGGAASVATITSRSIGRNPVSLTSYSRFLTGLPGLILSHEGQLDHFQELLPFEANEKNGTTFLVNKPGESLLAAENKGIILEGTVMDGDDNPVVGETVYIAFPGDITWVHLAVTDSSGMFRFDLEPEIGQPSQTVIRGSKTFDSSWEITLNSGFAEAPTDKNWPLLTLEKSVLTQLASYDQLRQLSGKYLDSGQNGTETRPGPNVKIPMYGEPDYRYQFADYTTMPTEEAFTEFIPYAYLRKPGKVKTLYLLNTTREELFPGPPLLMIDGVPVNSTAEILAVNYRLVDRVELITHPYVLNGSFFNGVLNLVTFQKDASSVVLKKGEIRAELLISPPTSSTGNQVLTGEYIPDFRRVNLIHLEEAEGSFRDIPEHKSVLPSTIWIQSINRNGAVSELSSRP